MNYSFDQIGPGPRKEEFRPFIFLINVFQLDPAGPRKKEYIILSGIAAWEPGQLDSEMMHNHWDRKLNNYTSLFDNGKEMWSRLINSRDIQLLYFLLLVVGLFKYS